METQERSIPKVGDRIQRYELIQEIGRGGFGVVFRARQAGLDEDVAVKIMFPLNADSAELQRLQDRFEQEAKLSKELKHPAAIKVRDFGRTSEGLPFLVSEFVEGRELTDLIYGEGLSTGRIVRIVSQILGCLAEAHHQGIIHRDLKPGNIKVRDIFGEPDSVKVLDFGIAKVPQQIGGVKTQTGLAFGTPLYMSPEQCRGMRDVDGRADLYALGLITAECVGRRRVVEGDDTMAVIYAHARLDPHAFSPEVVDSPLFPIIQRATEKERDRRYTDALTMRAELIAIGGELAAESYPSLSVPKPPSTGPSVHLPRLDTPVSVGPASSPAVHSGPTRPYDSGSRPTASPQARTSPTARGLRPWALLLVFVLLAVAGGAAYLLVMGDDGGPSVATPEPGLAGVEAEPAASAQPVAEQPERLRPTGQRQTLAAAVAVGTGEGPAGIGQTAVGRETEGDEAGDQPETAVEPEGDLALAAEEAERGEPAAPTHAERSAEGGRPATVTARIEGSPRNARVSLGGETVCQELPCDVRLPRGEGEERLRVSASGYQSERVRASLAANATYEVRLERERRQEPVPALPQMPVFGRADD